MKRLGMTDHGEILVALTQEEHRALCDLARVSDGHTIFLGQLHDPSTAYDYDLTQPLQAVIAYTRTLSLLNELELEVNSVKAAVMRRQKGEEHDD